MSSDRYLEEQSDKMDEYQEVMVILKQYCNDHSTFEQVMTIVKTHTGWDRAKVTSILKDLFSN